MTEAQRQHLKEKNWNPDKVVAIPDEIVQICKSKPGHQSTVAEITDKDTLEAFPNCTHLAFIAWLKTNGIWADYEAFINGGEAEEENINFAGRLNTAKEISDEENGVPKPPVAPKAPEVPKVETPVPSAETKEDEDEDEVRFDRYVERIKYIKEKGLELDTSCNGYVNKDKNRFVDANIVKNFEAPIDKIDVEWIKFVDQRLAIEWVHPMDIKVQEEEVLPDVTEGLEVSKNDNRHKLLIDAGLKFNEEKQEYSNGSIVATYSEFMDISDEQFDKCLAKALELKSENVVEDKKVEIPTVSEKPKELTAKEKDEIIAVRTSFLEDNGYKQDSQTYIFEHKELEDVRYGEIKDTSEKGIKRWDEISNAINTYNEAEQNLEPEKDNEIPPFVEGTEVDEKVEEKVSDRIKKKAKALEEKELDDEEDDLVGAVADYRQKHPEPEVKKLAKKVDENMKANINLANDLSEMQLMESLSNIFGKYAKTLFVLNQVKEIIDNGESDKKRIAAIVERLNY